MLGLCSCVCLVAAPSMRVGWRCTTAASGAQSVMTSGMTVTPRWCADNWALGETYTHTHTRTHTHTNTHTPRHPPPPTTHPHTHTHTHTHTRVCVCHKALPTGYSGVCMQRSSFAFTGCHLYLYLQWLYIVNSLAIYDLNHKCYLYNVVLA